MFKMFAIGAHHGGASLDLLLPHSGKDLSAPSEKRSPYAYVLIVYARD
jgi:hypothetical protein